MRVEFETSISTVSVLEYFEAIEDHCLIQRLTVCARYKLPNEESNMTVLEIDMISGLRSLRDSLNDLLHDLATGFKWFDDGEGTVVIYFDKLTAQKTCISFEASRGSVVDNPQSANIKLYDYYQQKRMVPSNYHFTQTCDKKTNEPPSRDREPREPSPRIMQKQMDGRQLDYRMSIADREPRPVQMINLNRDLKKLDSAIFEQEVMIER